MSPFSVADGNGSPAADAPQLRVELLGGFRVERVGVARPVSAWQRRTAKTLTKLLAVHPRHRLHREQILEILWPEVDVESALNSFGKTLHAARRALEPELLPRESSAYLRLTDSMVALDTEHVWVDGDHFQRLAESALRQGHVAGYESALAAYGGELLPEDRYEDWCAERREDLAGLHIQLLLGLAEAHEERGDYSASVARLREVLQHDQTSEDVHRRLMFLYASIGARDQAVRQFQLCEGALKREFGLAPEKSTVELYEEIQADQIPRRLPTPQRDERAAKSGQRQPTAAEQCVALVGRDDVLGHLSVALSRAAEGSGRLVLVQGEAGVGKTRLVAELTSEAERCGAVVLRGGSGAHANHLAYGPFAVALESYVASRPDSERNELAQLFPPLTQFVPSLGIGEIQPSVDRSGAELCLVPAIVRLLTDLARAQPLVLVLGDLHDLHPSSLDLLEYLVELTSQRRWLIVGTLREEALEDGTELSRLIDTTEREGLCLQIELEPLDHAGCAELVRASLPGGHVDDGFVDHVYARSVGNPLFVEELLREMRARGELILAKGAWQAAASQGASVPARVRALVAQRVAPMEGSVRRVLALAAANGMEISLADLRIGGAALRPPVSDAVLFNALDRALENRILEERDNAYAFRHPLVRSALYEDLSKHRRDELHAALDRSRTGPRVIAGSRRWLQPLS